MYTVQSSAAELDRIGCLHQCLQPPTAEVVYPLRSGGGQVATQQGQRVVTRCAEVAVLAAELGW